MQKPTTNKQSTSSTHQYRPSYGCPHLSPDAGRAELLKSYRAAVQIALLIKKRGYLLPFAANSSSSSKSQNGGSVGLKRKPGTAGVNGDAFNEAVLDVLVGNDGLRKNLTPESIKSLYEWLDATITAKCSTCQSWGGRQNMCLTCLQIVCSSSKTPSTNPANNNLPSPLPGESHIHQHLSNHFEKLERVARLQALRSKTNRTPCSHFSIELGTLSLYCFDCKDVVWDNELLVICDEEKAWINGQIQLLNDSEYQTKKGKFVLGSLTNEQQTEVQDDYSVVRCSGLRGLRNMGNTCYMNVILQSFVHNPLLRAGFLSDYHHSGRCGTHYCTMCELDKLFVNFFTGETTPYCPSSFLYNLWKSRKNMAGANQHDAHEFFIGTLWEMHMNLAHQASSHSNSHANSVHHAANGNCPCIAHTVFYGLQVSEIQCNVCKNISMTNEEFGDISLGLNFRKPLVSASGAGTSNVTNPNQTPVANTTTNANTSVSASAMGPPASVPALTATPATTGKRESKKKGREKKVKTEQGLGVNMVTTSPIAGGVGTNVSATPQQQQQQQPIFTPGQKLTLIDCFKKYTAPEKCSYTCAKCSKRVEATKQYSLLKLPPVLSIQIKRFEHLPNGTTRKITTPVHFQTLLDMSPYTTQSVQHRRKTHGGNVIDASELASPLSATFMSSSMDDSLPCNMYDLFAVIQHDGDLESGHYIMYAKNRGKWFRFDDAQITLAEETDVLKSNAYMLFYVRQNATITLPELTVLEAESVPSPVKPVRRNRDVDSVTSAAMDEDDDDDDDEEDDGDVVMGEGDDDDDDGEDLL